MNMDIQLLRLRDVERITCMKKSKIYSLIRDGKFPRPYKNGGQSIWLADEIKAWIKSLFQPTPPPA